MSEKIGYQSGIKAAMAALRKELPQYKAAWDKLERTLTILANDHDAALGGGGTPPPPPPPPPTFKKVAPRAAYKEGDADARFSLTTDGVTLRPGVFRRGDGKYSDESGAVYTTLDGLDESGIRAGAPAVTGAKQIDGRNLWDLPLTGDPTKNTGSWSI